MKRLATFATMILMVVAATAAAGIHVEKPGAGHFVFHGNTTGYMIKWTATGQINAKVKIRLYNRTGTTKIYGISDSTNTITSGTTGQFLWKQNMIDNTNYGDYVIRVKTLDNAHWDDSGIFHVKKKGGLSISSPKITIKPVTHISQFKKLIKVTSPVNGAAYPVNNAMSIVWNKNFGNYPNVNISLYGNNNKLREILFASVGNSGSVSWSPPGIYSFPGTSYYIKVKTSDNKFEGKSGIFTIINPSATPTPPQKKTLARSPVIKNKNTNNWNTTNKPDCLFAPTPGVPGRAATSAELKTGHHISEGKYKECTWVLNYYFTSDMEFDLSAIKGKQIIRAELLLTLSDHIQVLPPTSNTTCSTMSRIFEGNNLVKKFNILTPGEKAKIDILNSVKNWAASNQSGPYTLTIKDNLDIVSYISVCLKYYSQPILFVEYIN